MNSAQQRRWTDYNYIQQDEWISQVKLEWNKLEKKLRKHTTQFYLYKVQARVIHGAKGQNRLPLQQWLEETT